MGWCIAVRVVASRLVVGRRTLLTVGVEVIGTGAPRQRWLERRKEVEYDPGDDDHVIDGDHRYNHQRAVAKTWTTDIMPVATGVCVSQRLEFMVIDTSYVCS